MVRFFVMRIHEGEVTIENVPPYWREKVKKELDKE